MKDKGIFVNLIFGIKEIFDKKILWNTLSSEGKIDLNC
jgi:hypothetical protein